jgi:hypothetical protein
VPGQEPLFTSIVVAYYVNTNPNRERICPYCRAILGFLKYTEGDFKGKPALKATVPILVGQDLFYQLAPKQHVRCWCDWAYRIIPKSEIVNVLTDDDISFSAIFKNFSEEARKAAGEDKWPFWYKEEIRAKRRERRLLGGAFGLGTVIGLVAHTFTRSDYDKAKKRIRREYGNSEGRTSPTTR